MKFLYTIIVIFSLFGCKNQQIENGKNNQIKTKPMENSTSDNQTIYQFKVTDLQEKEFDFAALKGKKIMIVNTASKCGLTPQYKQLEEIYQKYKNKNFVIVGFPANNFGEQEPGSNSEISNFCTKNYGVSFPMMSKISVKGNDIHPIYTYLNSESEKKGLLAEVEWNFQKYLIDENGYVSKVCKPQTLPNDKEIIDWIEAN